MITTFLLCLLFGINILHAERDNRIQYSLEKQPEFITEFEYLPPEFECFADMFKYNIMHFPGFQEQDTLYFKKYTQPVNGYAVKEIHALNNNRCNAYVLCFEKGDKKFFVGGDGCGNNCGIGSNCAKDKTHIVDSIETHGVPSGGTITPHSFKLLKESQDSICLKAYNLHFNSAREYTDYGSSMYLTFCFTDIEADGQDELIIFSPYWGTCGFRIYDILETPQGIQLKSISGKDFDEARRLLIAPKEGSLLVWWRRCIYKYKILKNAACSITEFKKIDNVWSEQSDLFLSYTLEEPD